MLGMSRLELAKLLGITHRQVQKYEHGINRISVSRLVQIAAALEAPVGWFFRDVDQERGANAASETAFQLFAQLPEEDAREKLTALWEWMSQPKNAPKRPAARRLQRRAVKRRS